MIKQRELTGSSGSDIKSHNRRAVLLALLQQQGISRVRLARLTGLSSTTITNLVTELLAERVVEEIGTEGSPHNPSVGRPRTALQLVASARYAIGIHIGVGSVRVAVVDLLAHPLITLSLEHPLERRAEDVLSQTFPLVQEAIAQSGIQREAMVGVGVGASGLVDLERGINLLAPNLGWREVPLRDWVSQALELPVCVDNNVRAMALAESMFGKRDKKAQALAFVYARIGVGAGFVVNGQLYHGSVAGAGEIGHTTLMANGGEPCRCGNVGCLETLVSEPVIVRLAQRLAEQNPQGLLATALREEKGPLIDRVFSAAQQGDTATQTMLEERAHYMGLALANLINVLNPDLIVLGGLFVQGRRWLVPATEATMRSRAFGGLGERVRLEITQFGHEVGVIGAASLALNAFFYQKA
ncbi:MAG: ROK family protein [Anaerolineae bacterium]|nr:ROK family protein [Anaerolineae bacterium]